MQYEYKTMVLEVPRRSGLWTQKPATDELSNIDRALQELGDDGWQLVGVFPFTDGGSPAQISKAIHYFMRPKHS
ncbi:hypothetical protein Q31b_58920 [Novipirellula aureliae]|uniref:DUF4177 domain-containing protein n=1 Tax=Novipirellula aureliae TaxID=2527966 RepID=A0A5C6D780_9BACT|nr:DUF4177 domain-containing protein [Novipirellula aureliae]TWU31096.1 hypothetical protein Q31b_58920 [Novipirellula aureliae]